MHGRCAFISFSNPFCFYYKQLSLLLHSNNTLHTGHLPSQDNIGLDIEVSAEDAHYYYSDTVHGSISTRRVTILIWACTLSPQFSYS